MGQNEMYDSDRWDVIHETSLGLINSNDTAGSGIVGRFATYMNAKILEVTFIRHGLGTADEAGFDIYLVSTTTASKDAVVLGTAAVGSKVTATLTDFNMGSTDTMYLAPITSDTTLSAFVSITWQERFVA